MMSDNLEFDHEKDYDPNNIIKIYTDKVYKCKTCGRIWEDDGEAGVCCWIKRREE